MSHSDPNSFSNPSEARVASFHLNLNADFEKKILSGYVDAVVEVLKAGTANVIFDTKTMKLHGVTLQPAGTALEYKQDESKEPFGGALTITIPDSLRAQGSKFTVRINYETSPEASAIQWLPPSQTAGKKHPYLFTQCQAIHARSLLPCQDSPGNKTPYSASVTVPSPLTALMSALAEGTPVNNGATTTFSFKQPVPMSSYLVALAIGALEKRDIGPRSSVWSEKEMVEAGAHEFADTEKFIQVAENICGPYVWGRYDVLLLPPSFPYGGMENPCLTFVTPTLLAGDRSLANVVAHEIAHSWMGNLVSPVNWEHFWLNEGFTVFLERKILKALEGDKMMHLHAMLGWKALEDSVDRYGHDHPHTVLNVKLDGIDPDDAFSSVPYEKGFNLLFYLEQLVGGPAVMDPFLKAHCEKFGFGATTSQEWREFFLQYMKAHGVSEATLSQIDWDTWFHKPGMPNPAPSFDPTLINTAQTLAGNLIAGNAKPAADDIKGWSSNQIVVFLQSIYDTQKSELDAAKSSNAADPVKAKYAALLAAIDQAYNISASRNAEIRFKWLTVCVRAEMENQFSSAVQFLTEQGRMKFVRPLYRDLFQSQKGHQLALDTFKAHSHVYHGIASKMIAKDLELAQ